jgi:KipI family sensor histidine kinase inhibitor
MKLLPCGEHAMLVETTAPLWLARALRGEPGVLEVVPAARTLLVRLATSVGDPRAALAAALLRLPEPTGPGAAETHVELAVRYDGEDLDTVAAVIGTSVQSLIARHCAATYTVAFCGFAPGFAYLTGLDPSLFVARLDEPRTSVPAGSVAIADAFTGVYPRDSPGGWRLLGRTDAALWDTSRTPPALLTPGTTVRFRRT